MRLLSKKKVNFVITLITCCRGHLGNMHFMISYHLCHYLCILDILFQDHAYRLARRSNPTGIRGRGGGESGDTIARSSRRRGDSH